MLSTSVLDARTRTVFGADTDSIDVVQARARASFPDHRLIVWEGDPQTFIFSTVEGDSAHVLGHTNTDWLKPGFWVEQIVHPEDRGDALAYCALATSKGADHVFEYRALNTDKEVVWLRDYVRVIVGQRRIPTLLRGLMIDVSDEKRAEGAFDNAPTLYSPAPVVLRDS